MEDTKAKSLQDGGQDNPAGGDSQGPGYHRGAGREVQGVFDQRGQVNAQVP